MVRVVTTRTSKQPAARKQVPGWLIISAVLLLLVLFTLVLRLWSLNRVPPWLWWDEASQGLDARDLLHGQFQVFFPRAQGKEPMYIYLTTPFVAAWDGQPFAVRLAGGLLGVLMVPALYITGRALWWRQPRAGAWAGLSAAAFWATNFWPQSLNRIGFQVNALPLLLTVAVAAWLNWTRRPTRARAITFGLLAGLTVATYLAARITPVLWVALFLTLPAVRRRALRRTLPWALLTLTLVVAPLAVYFILHPQEAITRVSNFADVYQAPTLREQAVRLVDSARLVLGGFLGYAGDPIPRHNIPNRPPFSPALAILFGLGLLSAFGTLIGALRQRAAEPAVARAWTLLLWWGLLCLPAFLSANSNPHFPRLLAAVPPAFLLTSWPVAWAVSRLRTGAESRTDEHEISTAVPGATTAGTVAALPPANRGRRILMAVGAGLALLVLLEGATTARAYFDTWAGHTDLYSAYEGEMWTVGQQVGARPGALGIVPTDPSSSDALEYLYPHLPISHLAVTDSGQVGNWLAARLAGAGGAQVLTPIWQIEPYLQADPQGWLPFYLQREGTLAEETWFKGFSLQRFVLGSQPQFTAPGQTVDLNRTFSPDLDLLMAHLGAAYPNPDRNAPSAAAGTPLWAVLTWRVPRPLPDLRVALDLVDADGHRLVAAEQPLFDEQSLAGSRPADGLWRTYHLLPVPATQLAGPVRLEVRVYHPDTLTPLLPDGGATTRLSVPIGQAQVRDPLAPVDPATLHLARPVTSHPGTDLSLLGLDAWAETAAPGQVLPLRLYWQAGLSGSRDQTAVIVLAPAGISTTLSLPAVPPGRIFHTFANLHLPAGMPAGPQTLMLAAPAGAAPIALGTSSQAAYSVTVAGRPRQFDPPALSKPLAATFGDAVTLLGLPDAQDHLQVAAGQTLTVTLAWRATRTPAGDLTRFVHIQGPDRRPVAQRDGAPCADDACPSRSWLPGEVLIDEVRVEIPHNLAPGTYPVAVGWFDTSTQVRLPVIDSSGQRSTGDALALPLQVTVLPPLPDREPEP
jgi:hypothetical protein